MQAPTTTSTPNVSVIIPTFNRVAQTIAAIQSVEAQSYRNFELVVVDDGSTVELDCLRNAVAEVGSSLLEIEHGGVAAARNHAATCAQGEWLAFLDSDDAWDPRKLDAQVAFCQAHPELNWCQSGERWYRHGLFVNPAKHHQMPNGDAFLQSLRLCCISPSAVMIRRTLFELLGGFDERMRVCEDYDLWLRISATEPIGLIPETLVSKRGGHQDQLSRSEVAIDRFRIYALVKLLRSRILRVVQQQATFAVLAAKCRLLSTGARKHGQARLASEVDAIGKLAETSSLEPLCTEEVWSTLVELLNWDFAAEQIRERAHG